MTRTNIDLDDAKMDRVMRAYGLRSKREAVSLALDHLLGEHDRQGGMLAMRGTGWDADLDELRGPASS